MAAQAQPTTLGGRFHLADELGRGGFCVVHRGTDSASGKHVAVKMYHLQVAPEENLAKFRKEIDLFTSFGLFGDVAVDVNGISKKMDEAEKATAIRASVAPTAATFETLRSRPSRDCFVNLLGCTPEEDLPGGQCYTVLELADYTLEEFLVAKSRKKETVVLDEILVIARSLAESLAWIHVLGKVHLDVKPANLMRFGDRWKMIDMDGIQEASETRKVDCLYTPLYASPEVARAVIDNTAVKLSRSMDMWSFGVTVLDMLYGGAVLQETYSSFQSQMLFDDGDELDFFRFIGNSEEALDWRGSLGISATATFADKGLQDLVDKTLEKHCTRRISSAQALEHPFLLRRALGQPVPAPLKCGADLGASRPSAVGAPTSTKRRSLLLEPVQEGSTPPAGVRIQNKKNNGTDSRSACGCCRRRRAPVELRPNEAKAKAKMDTE